MLINGTTSIPVSGSPDSFGGEKISLPLIVQRGGDGMVTWSELFQFCIVITTVIALVRQDNNNKR